MRDLERIRACALTSVEAVNWLLAHARTDEARVVIEQMEAAASRRGPLPPPTPSAAVEIQPRRTTYAELLRDPTYLKRAAILAALWLFAYITVYGFASGSTSVLTALHYAPSEAGTIAAVGSVGFIACAVFCYFFGEVINRRFWLPIGAIVTLVGAVITGLAGTGIAIAFLGSVIIFFGFNMWVGPQYSLTAESFPTRARTAGFGLVDSVGHIGGGIGVYVIGKHVGQLSVLGALLLISSFLVVAAVIAQFSARTRNRSLTEVSP